MVVHAARRREQVWHRTFRALALHGVAAGRPSYPCRAQLLVCAPETIANLWE